MTRLLIVLTVIGTAACSQARKGYREVPPGAEPRNVVRLSALHAGGAAPADSTYSRYEDNAYALSEGRRLYGMMNCVGCHFHGGGGIGPALMDDEWIYGSDPAQIFRTIVEGRPNGMPSFEGKLSDQQLWQLVAYVRSLSGLSGTTFSSARDDHMFLSPDLALPHADKPGGATLPPP